MKNTFIPLSIILLLVIVLGILFSKNIQHTVNWEESFNERSKNPYGLKVFYNELGKLYEEQNFRTVYYQPDSYLGANSEGSYGDHIAEGTYLKIGNTMDFTFYSIEELLRFAEKGNTVFLSDYYFPNSLSDTLQFKVEYLTHSNKERSSLEFLDKKLSKNNIVLDRNKGSYFFKEISENTKILGFVKHEGHPNFIEIPFGEGTILLHLQPKAFTNYHLLKDKQYSYAEGILSYLPETDLYFDSYLKYTTPYLNDQEEESSDLGWFLEQEAFRWAWYLALLLTLLFVIFTAKRKQRIVPIVKPLENTSMAFVKTISNLYHETKDHRNMVDKKILYFLEKLRSQYQIDTSQLDEDFIEKLSLRSGVPKEKVKKLVDYMAWLKQKEDLQEIHLTRLNQFIEAFHNN
ncbi:MAG: hypothetical protein CL596_09955 [Alteromonas sp.]|nr:hypothetical protein [Alteromonas sp.]